MNRLGFTDTEASLLSFGEYADLYREYQNVFDMENILRCTKSTYKGIFEEEKESEKPIAF